MPSQKLRPVQKSAPGLLVDVCKSIGSPIPRELINSVDIFNAASHKCIHYFFDAVCKCIKMYTK